jgi:hypothetical protein
MPARNRVDVGAPAERKGDGIGGAVPLTTPETALLRELRAAWGTAYSITVEEGMWCAYPSYGPSREPIEANSGRELQRKLRRKQGFHIPPDENALEDRMST